MASPISSDKPFSPPGLQGNRAEDKGNAKAQGAPQGNEGPAAPAPQASTTATDQVTINQANQLQRQESRALDSDIMIDLPEEAAELAQRIREQIQSFGAMAMQAQGGMFANQANALLTSAPA
jgi:hypothetical protein